MFVYDDVLADPLAYREAALAGEFADLKLGPDLCFKGIRVAEDPTFPRWVASRFPKLTPTLSFFRKSPAGQSEPNYVHTDRDMGDWTAILYLNPTPEHGDGTTFWRHKSTGALESLTTDDRALLLEQLAWRDVTLWEPVLQVPAKFGRAVVFPAARFHSRSIQANYGIGDNARLVQIVFGAGALDKGHHDGSD